MLENNKKDLELNLEDLEGVSGGTGETVELKENYNCPVHKKNPRRIVIFYDNGRYQGGNLSRYKCAGCNRLYSLNQVLGDEDLSFDYTNIKFDDSF